MARAPIAARGETSPRRLSIDVIFHVIVGNGVFWPNEEVEAETSQDGGGAGDGDLWSLDECEDDHPEREADEEDGSDGVAPAAVWARGVWCAVSHDEEAEDGESGADRECEAHVGDEFVEAGGEEHADGDECLKNNRADGAGVAFSSGEEAECWIICTHTLVDARACHDHGGERADEEESDDDGEDLPGVRAEEGCRGDGADFDGAGERVDGGGDEEDGVEAEVDEGDDERAECEGEW